MRATRYIGCMETNCAHGLLGVEPSENKLWVIVNIDGTAGVVGADMGEAADTGEKHWFQGITYLTGETS